MLNPFVYPSFVLWAARLIRCKNPEQLGLLKRFIRSRLMLGTQMSGVEADIYERVLWFVIPVDLVLLPISMLFGYLLIYGPLFTSDFTPLDFLYALLGTVTCSAFVIGSVIYYGVPFLGRNTVKKHKVHPQIFSTLTDRLASSQCVVIYLGHLKRHMDWNPIYRLYWYAAATGSHWAEVEGHTHQKDSRFHSYSVLRAMYPAIPIGITIFMALLVGELPRFYSSLFCFLMINVFLLFLHLSFGRAHPSFFSNENVDSPVEITRANAFKLSALISFGALIGANFDSLKTWFDRLI